MKQRRMDTKVDTLNKKMKMTSWLETQYMDSLKQAIMEAIITGATILEETMVYDERTESFAWIKLEVVL